MNLEIPNKYKSIQNFATIAAKTIFRPVSRKYDLEEHEYPVELDLFAAGLNGMNEGSQGSLGGAATKREESVPKTTPIAITSANPKIVLPPKAIRGINTRSVIPEVMSVLLRVTLREWLIMELNEELCICFTSSRILSKIMIVSLRE